MHIRLITEHDVEQVVGLIHEVHTDADMAQGLRLNIPVLSRIMSASIRTPERYPCFVHDYGDKLTGMLFGFVVDTFFDEQRWFEERVFYIKPMYRSYRLASSFIKSMEEWCKEQGIKRVEVGNAFQPDPKIDKLYKRLGYAHVNTTHAKRL